MKKLALVAVLWTVGLLAFAAPLPYDSSAVKDIMHSNFDQTKAIQKGLAAGDFVSVGNAFIQLAQNAQKARQYAPPKGDAQEWNRIWEDFLTNAFLGVGAAGAKDAAKAKAQLDAVMGDQRQGHPQFKG